jgi:hypothetical protein
MRSSTTGCHSTATKPGTTPLGLEDAHRDLRISPAEFDAVAAELGRTLDFFKKSGRFDWWRKIKCPDYRR